MLKSNNITLENLTLSYNGNLVFDKLSFQIEEGKILGILGPSGCGKTSILNILSGIIEPNYGDVILNENSLLGSRIQSSYMFQDDLLLPWRNILDNVCLPLELDKNLNIEKEKNTVLSILEDFGLSKEFNKYPHQISGGMKRRAAFVRTLCIDRMLYLFDEPTSGLDYMLRIQLEDELFSFLIKYKKTAIIVTHDIETVIALSDRIILLTDKPSKIRKEYISGYTRKYVSPSKVRKSEEFSNLFKTILNDISNGNH
ncbi:MAG: transporter family protein [Ignavibacteria bacterium]|nr:transporter family protein [Ignavibacteria bacterium]